MYREACCVHAREAPNSMLLEQYVTTALLAGDVRDGSARGHAPSVARAGCALIERPRPLPAGAFCSLPVLKI